MTLAMLFLLLVPGMAMRANNQAALTTQVNLHSAQETLEHLWTEVMSSQGVPAEMPSALAPLRLMEAAKDLPILGRLISWANITEDLSTTFSWRQDYPLPPGHTKLIHPVGSVAKIELIWDEEVIARHGYTGVFSTDQKYALMRVGPAGALKDKGMAPGVSIKVLRDYKESVNTLMLYSLRGQDGFSHFEHTLCNKLSDFPDKSFAESLLLKSFKHASKYPFTTGLSQWAEQDGKRPKFPFVLCLRPVDKVRKDFEQFQDKPFEHIQEQLRELNPRTQIYDIYAAPAPRVKPTKVGTVVMRTKFYPSAWGDESLFFRHDWFENDLEYEKEWKEQVDQEDFWLEEGAAHFYSSIDPGQPAVGTGNAWAGGYNPSSASEMMKNLRAYTPFLPWGWFMGSDSDSLMQVSGGGCPFAYLQQGQNRVVHKMMAR